MGLDEQEEKIKELWKEKKIKELWTVMHPRARKKIILILFICIRPIGFNAPRMLRLNGYRVVNR